MNGRVKLVSLELARAEWNESRDDFVAKRSGKPAVDVCLAKYVTINGEEKYFENHRTVIPPGTDPVKQMAAVNVHLAQMGFAAVEPAELADIVAFVRKHHNVA
jgi:hypothetical protein